MISVRGYVNQSYQSLECMPIISSTTVYIYCVGAMVKEHSSLISQFDLISQIITKITVNNNEYCTLSHRLL